jgi:hypothetical protein
MGMELGARRSLLFRWTQVWIAVRYVYAFAAVRWRAISVYHARAFARIACKGSRAVAGLGVESARRDYFGGC